MNTEQDQENRGRIMTSQLIMLNQKTLEITPRHILKPIIHYLTRHLSLWS